MSDTIFLHCQSFSRKPNGAGQSVRQVISEGLRNGGFHNHVSNPKPPVPVYGDLRDFQERHDNHVAQCRTRVIKAGRVTDRAIRFDRHTLFTIVSSYPVPTSAVQASEEEAARFRRWASLSLGWVRRQYGDQLAAAFAHLDESFPHLHFWLLGHNADADAGRLHPGKAAKRDTERRLAAEGVAPREVVKEGNRALRHAMRAWIDDYHRTVGAPLGLRRDGPKRRRLSRAQYQAEQAMLDHHRRLGEERAQLVTDIAGLTNARGAASRRVAGLEAKATVMAEQQREVEEMLSQLLEQAEKHKARMRAEVAQISAAGPMLDALIREISQKSIRYDAKLGWCVRDVEPFLAAGKVWRKLSPVVQRLLDLIESAEGGRWRTNTPDPVSPAYEMSDQALPDVSI